jgi:Zn finger protein HypA/HybF involved in hydrogenase expression
VQVSPHRKGKRSATKFIRFVPVVAQCSKCERVFEQHAMPSKCEEDECPAFNLRSRPS